MNYMVKRFSSSIVSLLLAFALLLPYGQVFAEELLVATADEEVLFFQELIMDEVNESTSDKTQPAEPHKEIADEALQAEIRAIMERDPTLIGIGLEEPEDRVYTEDEQYVSMVDYVVSAMADLKKDVHDSGYYDEFYNGLLTAAVNVKRADKDAFLKKLDRALSLIRTEEIDYNLLAKEERVLFAELLQTDAEYLELCLERDIAPLDAVLAHRVLSSEMKSTEEIRKSAADIITERRNREKEAQEALKIALTE